MSHIYVQEFNFLHMYRKGWDPSVYLDDLARTAVLVDPPGVLHPQPHAAVGGLLAQIGHAALAQGILAVARQKAWTLADVLGKSSGREAERPGARGGMIHRPPLLVILETLQDPGNLGTILRAGEGAGVTGVIMNEESADIYNPKVIRSTMGAIFRVPFLVTPDLRGTIREIREMGIRVYAAHLHGTAAYEEMDYREPSGFLIGNEAAGLTKETAALADARVIIPMAGRVESLNAAIAASVLLFEAARQRRDRKDG